MKKLFTTLLGLLWAAATCAQADYPSRPVRIIVPFAAGSTADITARAVGQVLARGLGQPVIIDNRPGAGGTMGMATAARSPADGYTLVMATVATTAIAAATMKNPGFDMARDFTPVSLVANATLVLLVSQDAGVKTLSELIALGKRSPGQVTYGNVSTMYQLAMELLNRQAGTDFRAIPYRGPQEAAVDLLGGRLTLLPDTVSSALRSIESGKARPVAILSSRRSPVLPDVPTVLELVDNPRDKGALKLIASTSTVGRAFIAPPGVPAERLDILRKGFDAMVADPKFQAEAEKRRLGVDPMEGEELRAIVADVMSQPADVVERMKEVTAPPK